MIDLKKEISYELKKNSYSMFYYYLKFSNFMLNISTFILVYKIIYETFTLRRVEYFTFYMVSMLIVRHALENMPKYIENMRKKKEELKNV